jgi:hypothetical protein
MRGAVSPLPQYTFVALCSVKKRHRDNFTFTYVVSVLYVHSTASSHFKKKTKTNEGTERIVILISNILTQQTCSDAVNMYLPLTLLSRDENTKYFKCCQLLSHLPTTKETKVQLIHATDYIITTDIYSINWSFLLYVCIRKVLHRQFSLPPSI